MHRLTALYCISIIIISTATIYSNELSPVGFIWHYPFVDAYTDVLPNSGANTQNCRAVWAAIEPEHNKFDFTSIDKQINFAQTNNQKLVLVLEFNPFCRPQWAKKMIEEAGETAKDFLGNDVGFPHYKSKLYSELQENFIENLSDHINRTDTTGVITHYQAGIEWWFPYNTRYAQTDIEGFREWLKNKYTYINNLNKRWDASIKSFDEAPYPIFDAADIWVKNRSGISRLVEYNENIGYYIINTREPIKIEITPGKKYIFRLRTKFKNVIGRGIFIEAAWHNNRNEIFSSIRSGAHAGKSEWTSIELPCIAPENALKVSLHIHFEGMGEVWFDEPFFSDYLSEKNYATPIINLHNVIADEWSGRIHLHADNIAMKVEDIKNNKPVIYVNIPVKQIEKPYKNIDAVYYDWFMYWKNETAKYINSLATLVKKYDKHRKTASFLTYSSALPAEWDYFQWSGVSLDEVTYYAKDIDVLGMQLPIAQGDPYRIEAALDIARKYSKPMWNLDLQDFAAGIHIGKSAIEKASHAAIQHGATGLIYCNWNGAKDFNFYPDLNINDISQMLTDAKSSLDIVKEMKPFAESAIILPFLPSSPIDITGMKNDVTSFIGWYKILSRMDITNDVITISEVERDIKLNRYKWILIPDCAFISDKAIDILQAYQDNGGYIISGGRFGNFDEIRNKKARDLKASLKLIDYGKNYAGILNRYNNAGDTPPMFIWGEDTAKRKKIFKLAERYLNDFFVSNELNPDFKLNKQSSFVTCTTMIEKNRKCFYLVNKDNAAAKNISLDIPINEINTIKIYSDCIEKNAVIKNGNGITRISLPEFNHSTIVIIE